MENTSSTSRLVFTRVAGQGNSTRSQQDVITISSARSSAGVDSPWLSGVTTSHRPFPGPSGLCASTNAVPRASESNIWNGFCSFLQKKNGRWDVRTTLFSSIFRLTVQYFCCTLGNQTNAKVSLAARGKESEPELHRIQTSSQDGTYGSSEGWAEDGKGKGTCS